MKRMSKFARRCAALMLAVVLLCMAVPAAFAAEGDTLPAGATTMGGANTTLIPDEEENCLSWLFGSGDTITMPYLNVKGQGLRRNVTLDLEDSSRDKLNCEIATREADRIAKEFAEYKKRHGGRDE